MADKILKSLNFGTEDDYYFAQSADKINGVISVENGGFGATTADEARRNIGAASEIFVGNLSTKLFFTIIDHRASRFSITASFDLN